MSERADIVVVGAGAAGLMAAIWAGRAGSGSGRQLRIIALDGARLLGAKILVAGGGRCNVTHHAVDESAYAGGPGSTRNAIKAVLRRFDVPRTIEFFDELGVELKREETGKLFPTTDSARTVLDALLHAAIDAGVQLVHPWRVESVVRTPDGFEVVSATGEVITAERVILATGGKSLPKSGSDGHGHAIARSLGHTIASPVLPALVPLTLDGGRTFITGLSGVTVIATITLWSATGKKLVEFTDSMLCTHFGVSGPAALDISRYYLMARSADPGVKLTVNWLPGQRYEDLDAALISGGAVSAVRRLSERGAVVGGGSGGGVPERLAKAICSSARIEPGTACSALTRDARRAVAHAATATALPITGDRGYTYAEVTAGGVPLNELHLDRMESRIAPGLHICGELCDVDGRIGGFNFQWAWASGHLAGRGATEGLNR